MPKNKKYFKSENVRIYGQEEEIHLTGSVSSYEVVFANLLTQLMHTKMRYGDVQLSFKHKCGTTPFFFLDYKKEIPMTEEERAAVDESEARQAIIRKQNEIISRQYDKERILRMLNQDKVLRQQVQEYMMNGDPEGQEDTGTPQLPDGTPLAPEDDDE